MKVGIDIFAIVAALSLFTAAILPPSTASNQRLKPPQMTRPNSPPPAFLAPPRPQSPSITPSRTNDQNERVHLHPNMKLQRIHVAIRREEDESQQSGARSRQRRRRTRRRGRQGGAGSNRAMPPGVRPVNNRGGRVVYDYGGHPFDEYKGETKYITEISLRILEKLYLVLDKETPGY